MAIFISYSHSDNDFIDKLVSKLKERRVPVYLDKMELGVGDSIIEKIQDAITDASHLIVVISNNSINSNWCKLELSAGFIRELEESETIVLPIVIDDCKIPLFLRTKLYLDFRNKFDVGFEQLIQSLLKLEKIQGRSLNKESKNINDYGFRWYGDNNKIVVEIDSVQYSEIVPRPKYIVTSNFKIISDQNYASFFNSLDSEHDKWNHSAGIIGILGSDKNFQERQIKIPHTEKIQGIIKFYSEPYNFQLMYSARRLGLLDGFDFIWYIGLVFKEIWEEIMSNNKSS